MPTETNFRQIILDLMQHDLTLTEIERRTNISKSLLSRYLHGSRKEPLFSKGQRLVELHKEVVGECNG